MPNKPPPIAPEQLEALTAEASLLDVYRLSRRIRKRAIYKYLIVELSTAVSVAAVAYFSQVPGPALAALAREWLGLGFNFAVAILGFLLAGYTIFATLTGADFARVLVAHNYGDTNISYLKYTTVQFMQVFIDYVFFVAVYLIAAFFGWKGGLFTMLCGAAQQLTTADAWRVGSIMAMSIVSGLLAHLWMTLQAFIFNIYGSVMAMARLRLMDPDDDIKG